MTNSKASFKSFWLIANEISIIDEEESRNGSETSLHFINVSCLFDSFGNFLCHFGNQYKIQLNTRLSCSARDKIKDWKRLYHQLSIAGDHIAIRNHFFFPLHPNITQPPWTLVKGQMHTHYGNEYTAQRDGTAGGYRFGWSIQTGQGGATALTTPSLPFLPSWDKS